jgi:hypothetical protein
MAALLNRLGWLGIGVAGVGVVVETALFNGTDYCKLVPLLQTHRIALHLNCS